MEGMITTTSSKDGSILNIIKNIFKSYYSVLLMVALWELVGTLKLINPFLVPPLEKVLGSLYWMAASGILFIETGITLKRALLGFFISIAISVPIGIGMSRIKFIKWFFDPIISIGFPAPKIAFLPVICLWFGMYDTSKVILAILSCSFPIIIETYLGTLETDKFLIWSAQNMGMKDKKLLWKVIFPMTLPQIFNGIQIAAPISLVTIVLAEMLAGGRGLGAYMMVSGRFARSDQVFAALVVLAILGYLLMAAMVRVRKRLLTWHEEAQKD